MKNIESRLKKVEEDLKPSGIMAVFTINNYTGDIRDSQEVLDKKADLLKKEYLEAGHPPFKIGVFCQSYLDSNIHGIGELSNSFPVN